MKDEGGRMKDEGGMMKDEKNQDLKARTRNYALRIIRLRTSLPKTPEAQVIGGQMLRSGTSPGAHYREAQRAKSDADFISKMEGALQEFDETGYWLELLVGAEIMPEDKLRPLLDETDELIAIFVSIVTKVKDKRRKAALPSSGAQEGQA